MLNNINKLKLSGWILGIAVVALLGWVFFVIGGSTSRADIHSIDIRNNDLIIRGQNLDRVEIWGALDLDSAKPVKLGDAEEILTRGRGSSWIFEIPSMSRYFPDTFARGYADGSMVGEVHLSEDDQDFLRLLWENKNN